MEKNDTPQDDWSIGDLYKKSWNLIKTNKVLWLFGMASLVYGSFNSHSSSNFNPSKYLPSPTPSAVPGMSPLPSPSPEGYGLVTQLFSSVPVEKYVLLGLVFAVLVIIGLILNFIYGAWATSSLIHGIELGLKNQKVTIKDSSSKAFSAIKGLIWLQIIPGLILGVLSAVVAIVLVLLIVALPGAVKALPVILLVGEIIIVVVAAIFLALSQIWAQRRVILEGQKAKEALLASFGVAKKLTGSMIVLSIVNALVSLLVTIIPLTLIGGAGVAGFIIYLQNRAIAGNLITAGVVFILIIFLAYSVVAGGLQAFKASVWTIAYEKIKGRFNGK